MPETTEEKIIEIAAKDSASITTSDKTIIEDTISQLDKGQLRVAYFCEKNKTWQTRAWVKQAILLYFKIAKMHSETVGPFEYFDKIPLKKDYKDSGVRVVPPAVARYGSHIEEGAVLMPSYVNIGAFVGARTMVDTWATVGSCAQIGCDVHLSGGVGIGGVLEPVGSTPVIIEDGAFIGSRCIVVEGVRIEKEAVLAANCTITASTPIIDTRVKPFKIFKGHIPKRCVVLPGVQKKEVAGGDIHTSCVYIIGQRKESTDRKTSLNAVLRDYSLSV